jgi:hypothetical protein
MQDFNYISWRSWVQISGRIPVILTGFILVFFSPLESDFGTVPEMWPLTGFIHILSKSIYHDHPSQDTIYSLPQSFGIHYNYTTFRVITLLPGEPYQIHLNNNLEPPLMPHRQHAIHYKEFVCLFLCRCSPARGLASSYHEVSWSHTTTRHNR